MTKRTGKGRRTVYGEVAEAGDGAAPQLRIVRLQTGQHGLNAAGLADRNLVRICSGEREKKG